MVGQGLLTADHELAARILKWNQNSHLKHSLKFGQEHEEHCRSNPESCTIPLRFTALSKGNTDGTQTTRSTIYSAAKYQCRGPGYKRKSVIFFAFHY